MEKNRYYMSIADISIGIKTDFDVLIGQEGEQFFCRESIPTNIKNDISFNIQKTNNPLIMGKKYLMRMNFLFMKPNLDLPVNLLRL